MTKVLFMIGNIEGAHEIFESQKEAIDYRQCLINSGEPTPEIQQLYCELSDSDGEMEILSYINKIAFSRKRMAQLECMARATRFSN